jgi:hypothetical protein
MDEYFVPAGERAEMLRSHMGLVTALIDGAPEVWKSQIGSIVAEQADASRGDIAVFAGRMAKQIEAGARVTHGVIKLLASRLGISEAEANRIVAEAYGELGPDDMG